MRKQGDTIQKEKSQSIPIFRFCVSTLSTVTVDRFKFNMLKSVAFQYTKRHTEKEIKEAIPFTIAKQQNKKTSQGNELFIQQKH